MPSLRDHPAVQRFHARRAEQAPAGAAAMLSADELRRLCLDCGADDAGFVEIGRPELDDQRADILRLYPFTETLVAIVCRLGRESLRSPALSVANVELHQVEQGLESAAHRISAALERRGVRAVAPAVGFPMEIEAWPRKMHVVSHKPVAVAAGLGKMGRHRNVIHPVFGSFALLDTVLVGAKVDRYDRPLDYDPCVECRLCVAACPTGAIAPDGHFHPLNCMTHTYRQMHFGFSDWVEQIAASRSARDYRARVTLHETITMWQGLATGPCYRSCECLAVCPAGDDVLGRFLQDRKAYVAEVVKPQRDREETVYVLPGSDAEEHVRRHFPNKRVRRVSNGVRIPSIAAFLGSAPLAFQRNHSRGLSALYHFTFTGDEELAATIEIRDGKISVRSGHEGEADLRIRADSQAWLRVVRHDSSALKEILLRRIRVKGPMSLLKAFGRCFA